MVKIKDIKNILIFTAAFAVCATGCSRIGGTETRAGISTNEDSIENWDTPKEQTNNSQETSSTTRIEQFPSVKPVMAGISDALLDYNFWVSKLEDGKKQIMDAQDIKNFNAEIRKKVNTVVDLTSYKQNLSRQELSGFINEYKLPVSTKYDENGKLITGTMLKNVYNNTNLKVIKENNEVSYGITVKKTSVRSFPTQLCVYDSKDSKSFDRFQETSIAPCHLVIILHESTDKKWYFVQSYNYRGWVKEDDIALSNSKEQAMDYINSNKFITVTGNHISMDNKITIDSDVNTSFSMGDRLPLVLSGSTYEENSKNYYVVKIAVKGTDNLLDFKEGLISKSKDVVEGYLPYTRENIVKQAFKLQGDKYDWGNKYDGRDCSSFVADIYKTFGIMLPRNSQEQEESFGKLVRFSSADNLEKRNKLLDSVQPGTIIFMPGHEMLYLGKIKGTSYMIHDFTSYGKKEGDKYIYTSVFSVNVTPTTITLSSGASFISKFTSALQIEK